jgi:thiol:disulfide interchange protein
MFQKSLLLVVTVLATVMTTSVASQLWLQGPLPSAFDKGVTLEQAFKQGRGPIMVEFYSDACGTCRKVAPWVHHAAEQQGLTLVMVDTQDPKNFPFVDLFGVKTLPALFVFDFQHMKKHQVPLDSVTTEATLKDSLKAVLPG